MTELEHATIIREGERSWGRITKEFLDPGPLSCGEVESRTEKRENCKGFPCSGDIS